MRLTSRTVQPMALSLEHTTSENLAWVRWWAFAWHCAHQDWRSQYPEIDLADRNGALVINTLAGISSCLPPPPQHAVLRLAHASTEQLDLALTLIHNIVDPAAAPVLSESHQRWCMSLSKALSPDMLLPDSDPFQLLRIWVGPATWQRLRLRFPCKRVFEIEKHIPAGENATNRLMTLWQAIVWRATSMTNLDTHTDFMKKEISDAPRARN